MDINSISASYLSRYTAQDSGSERGSRSMPDPKKTEGTSASTSASLAAEQGAMKRADRKDPAEDSRKPATLQSNSLNPHYKIKDADGTRVMEVYDSKDVLIYQVPPKGLLMLIQNQEQATQSQVETTA